ncbi:Protein kinase domain-containing protein [Meloidogyne graminicola]|uniref:Protein kinase domain-containing protein n=1 Tax=Meloidogyne graminicola TaxID=189291 RepID=A0A8S9ZHL4_9BILA|nr:Protein kinase domain-containing protein [Meloidogyne graminicola]
MNSDDVFKAWEENMKIETEKEEIKRLTKHSVTFPINQSIRKNSSLHGKNDEILQNGIKTKNLKKMQRALSTTNIILKENRNDNESEEIKQMCFLRGINDVINFNKTNSNNYFDGTNLQIQRVSLENDYKINEKINDGKFGKNIFTKQIMAEHVQSKQKISLKLFSRQQIKLNDFYREYENSRFLCAHPNIVDTFEGCFETADENLLFFVQEPIICNTQTLRDLLNANPGGLCENTAKAILSKVIAAIEFIHSESLVHRAIRAENIIVGDPGKFTKVKLTELGSVRTVDSIIRHTEIAGPYHAPELCERVPNETFSVAKQTDIWALAILIAYCMKGKFPWQKATIMCKPFYEWDQWLKRKAVQQPKYWDSFADKAMRMFKHSLNPKPKERWDIRGIRKFIEKERFSKSKTSSEDDVYYPDEGVGTRTIEGKQTKKTSTIGQWINNTLNTMSEISEQVVSARDDD